MKMFFHWLAFYHGRLKGKLYVILLLLFLAVAFEGLSLALLLPILLYGDSKTAGGSGFASAVTDAFRTFGMEAGLGVLLLALIAFLLCKAAFTVLRFAYVGRAEAELLVDMRQDMLRRLYASDYLYVASRDAGYVTNAVAKELPRVGHALSALITVIVTAALCVLYLAWPLFHSPQLLFLLACAAGLLYLVMRILNRLTRELSARRSDASAGHQGFLLKAVADFKYFKATGSGGRVLDQVHRRSRGLGGLYRKFALLAGVSRSIFEPAAAVILAAVVYYHAEMRHRSLIEIAFFVFLLYRGLTRLFSIQSCWRNFLVYSGSLATYETFSGELARHEEPAAGGTAPDFTGALELRGVTFGYPGQEPVLRDLTLTIPPKTVAAIVGASGVGKTTIIDLIAGILKPSAGDLRLGGAGYGVLDIGALRRGIGCVPQGGAVFNDSIVNNITLWEEDPGMTGVEAAARRAHIAEVIARMPDGYETVVGEGGSRLSGGERQRLGIARELYKDAPLLIFDEATSELDGVSEAEIQKSIAEMRGERTVVMVAHRRSTIRAADRIFVLKDGAVAEEGGYDELLERGGEFAALAGDKGV